MPLTVEKGAKGRFGRQSQHPGICVPIVGLTVPHAAERKTRHLRAARLSAGDESLPGGLAWYPCRVMQRSLRVPLDSPPSAGLSATASAGCVQSFEADVPPMCRRRDVWRGTAHDAREAEAEPLSCRAGVPGSGSSHGGTQGKRCPQRRNMRLHDCIIGRAAVVEGGGGGWDQTFSKDGGMGGRCYCAIAVGECLARMPASAGAARALALARRAIWTALADDAPTLRPAPCAAAPGRRAHGGECNNTSASRSAGRQAACQAASISAPGRPDAPRSPIPVASSSQLSRVSHVSCRRRGQASTLHAVWPLTPLAHPPVPHHHRAPFYTTVTTFILAPLFKVARPPCPAAARPACQSHDNPIPPPRRSAFPSSLTCHTSHKPPPPPAACAQLTPEHRLNIPAHTTCTTTTMFDENFTFSRSPSWASTDTSHTREPSRSVSPCSPTFSLPPPQGYSVTDLAADLDRQRIRPDARICYQSCHSYANTTDDDSAWAIPPSGSDSEGDATYHNSSRRRTASSTTLSLARSRAGPARSYSPTRRAARQSGTRMLCASGAHAKDIAALVARMVSASDQCSVAAPPDSLPRAAAEAEEADDEGYNSAGGEEAASACSSRRNTLSKRNLDYRRALDSRTGTGAAAISKDIRFRGAKDKGHRRHRSSGEKGGVA